MTTLNTELHLLSALDARPLLADLPLKSSPDGEVLRCTLALSPENRVTRFGNDPTQATVMAYLAAGDRVVFAELRGLRVASLYAVIPDREAPLDVPAFYDILVSQFAFTKPLSLDRAPAAPRPPQRRSVLQQLAAALHGLHRTWRSGT